MEPVAFPKAMGEMAPGQSLGIPSVPNLRDLGGYKTESGATVAKGLVYRSDQI
jgi:protein-tyrosine phosphatase